MARAVLWAWCGSLALFQLLSTVAVRGAARVSEWWAGGLVGGSDGAWLPRGSSPRVRAPVSPGVTSAPRAVPPLSASSDGDISDICS